MLGLWTPIVGTSVAVIEAWKILTLPGDRWLWLLLGTVSGALAMLGPGRWSIDARLFGWKRVEAPPRKTVLFLVSEASQTLISWLRRGCYSPPKRFRFVPMWGCAQMQPVDNCAH